MNKDHPRYAETFYCMYCREIPDLREETQDTIHAWAVETFGNPTPMRVVERSQEELDELRFELETNGLTEKAIEEVADVFIVLYRLAGDLGVDIHDVIDWKMAKNRARSWNVKDGVGQHVEEP